MGLITEKTPIAKIQPVKFILNWGRRYSLWVMNFGLACCAIEFIAASTAKNDFIRLGVIPFAHGPRQADLLVVAGDPLVDLAALGEVEAVFLGGIRVH